MSAFLTMESITKTFSNVLANKEITFEVERGEIHALLGENGAGKTTLMNVLSGLYRPDGGQIYLRGKPVYFESPKDAIRQGIGMVHQQFMLIPAFTVTENIVLGLPAEKPLWLDLDRANEHIATIAEGYGLRVPPKAYIWQLPVGVQQRVEILKALYRGAELLILDEPTAVLTPGEIQDLFRVLNALKAEGHTIIFISHKLKEVMEISDRITILRAGQVIETVRASETSPQELAQMMVGRPVMMDIERKETPSDEVVLQVEGLLANDDRNLPALQGVTFELHRGEILGIAGVDGNGQTELAEVILGARKLTAGRITIREQDLTGASIRNVLNAGVGYIPANRLAAGLIASFSLVENLILKSFTKSPFCRLGWLNLRVIHEHASVLLRNFDVRALSALMLAKQLSGGNQQKVVLAREISGKPDVLVAAQPTRGLDIGATEYVLQKLVELRSKGVGILLISTELDEILSVSDRIAVIYEGQIMGILPAQGASAHQIGLMMAGMNRTTSEATVTCGS